MSARDLIRGFLLSPDAAGGGGGGAAPVAAAAGSTTPAGGADGEAGGSEARGGSDSAGSPPVDDGQAETASDETATETGDEPSGEVETETPEAQAPSEPEISDADIDALMAAPRQPDKQQTDPKAQQQGQQPEQAAALPSVPELPADLTEAIEALQGEVGEKPAQAIKVLHETLLKQQEFIKAIEQREQQAEAKRQAETQRQHWEAMQPVLKAYTAIEGYDPATFGSPEIGYTDGQWEKFMQLDGLVGKCLAEHKAAGKPITPERAAAWALGKMRPGAKSAAQTKQQAKQEAIAEARKVSATRSPTGLKGGVQAKPASEPEAITSKYRQVFERSKQRQSKEKQSA